MSGRSPFFIVSIGIALTAGTASANGNVSHLQVTLWAVDELSDGDLVDLLSREDVDLMLRNGANFPDGGYAVDDGYGEIAHWEPFQTHYLDWIASAYEPPWSDEAAQHIAFLMGMASHGMCDQVYDGMYLERSNVHDEGTSGTDIGRDGSTDVCFAAEAGPLYAPDLWIPDELMAELMLEQAGHSVDPGTIRDGQALVAFSLYYVSEASQDPDEVAIHQEAYPWACAHQLDESVPGSPPAAARVVAAYWQALWARLHGEDPLEDLPLAWYPDGTFGPNPAAADDIESMVSFVVPRGLDSATVNTDLITVQDEPGDHLDVQVHHYYGHASHVVNLRPVHGWTPGGHHEVSTGPGLLTWDGLEYILFGFTFGVEGDPPQEEETGCTCTSHGPGARPAVAALVAGTAWFAARRRR